MRRRALLRAAGVGAGALALSTLGSATERNDAYAPLGTVEVSNSAEAVVSDDGTVAYVAKTDGFATVDVSDPASPELLAEITDVEPASGDGRILDVKVEGDRLLLPGPANGGSPTGFELYDVSDPSNPSQVGEFFETGHAIHNAFLHEGYAYLTDNSTADRPLHVVDVSNDSPESVARWSPLDYDAPDVEGWSEVSFVPGTIHDVYVQDGMAYCAYWDAGTWMVDVSDPANPEYRSHVGDYSLERLVELANNTGELSELFLEAPGNAHYVDVNDDSTLLAVGGEAWDNPRTEDGGPAGIDLYDISDITNPRRLSTIEPETADDMTRGGTWTTSHNFELLGDRLYSSWYQAGVKIHDVSDPTAPEQLAWWLKPEEAYFWTAQVGRPGEFFVASTYGGKSTAPGLYVFPDEAGQQENRPSLGGEPRTTTPRPTTPPTTSGTTRPPTTTPPETPATDDGEGTGTDDGGGDGTDDGDGGSSGSTPGFGVLAAVGGLGLGAYRYLRRTDGE